MRLLRPGHVVEAPSEHRGRANDRDSIAAFAMAVDRPAQERDGLFAMGRGVGGLAGPLEQLAFLGRIGGHGQGLLQEGDRLHVRAEGDRAFGGASQGDACLGGEGVGLGSLGGVLVGGQVLAGQRARQLVGAEGLEVAGGGEVAGLPVASGERVVGDLADERLDERVLTALGRSRVHGSRVSSSRRTRPRGAARGRLPSMPETAASAGDA